MAQNDDNKEPEMPNNYMPSYSTGVYGSYILMSDTSDDEGEAEPGSQRAEEKADPETQSFLDTSAQKKQQYNQYESLSDMDANNIPDAVKVDNPHFLLTLNDLSDFGVDNRSEVDTLKELQNCIENKLQNPIINAMRNKLAAVYQVVAARVVITDIYYGTANIGHIILGLGEGAVVEIIKNTREYKERLKAQFSQYKDSKITPAPEIPESTDGSYALIKSYHVSCASDRPGGSCDSNKPCNNWDCASPGCYMAGVVLYMKDGKTRWKCGNRSCRTGYIILKQTNNLEDVTSSFGQVHGKVYKSVFNEEPNGIVGSGIVRSRGAWKWKSGSFNCGYTNNGTAKYHNNSDSKNRHLMNEIESRWIKTAIDNWWRTGSQNTKVTENLVIFKE